MKAGLHGVQYRCVAANSAGTGESKVFTLYTVPAVTDTSPAKTTFVPGESLSMSVRAEALNGVTVSYQWQVSSDGGKIWENLTNENNRVCSILVDENMDNRQYRCMVTFSYPGGDTKVVYTSAKTLRVVRTPVIASQPRSATVTEGADTALSVTVSGSYYNLTYQWQVSTNGGKTWTDISDADGAQYTLSAVTPEQNGTQYRCILTHWLSNVENSHTSDAVTLTVVSAPNITVQPKDITCPAGQKATFNVTAAGNQSLSYQWQISSDGGKTWTDISGADGAEYTVSAVTRDMDGTLYRCAVTNSADGQSLTVFSDAALLSEHTHSYVNEWKSDTASHWHECTECGAKTDEAEHTDTNKDHQCDICEKVLSECSDNNSDHKCDLCGKVLSEHTGGTATCKDKAVCKVCGESYGELDPNNHANLKHIDAKAATKTAEGNTEYRYCEDCGKYFADKDGNKEINKEDTVTEKLTDEKPTSPKTGDTSNLALWITVLFLSSAVSVTSIFSRKKKYSE